MVIPPCEVDDAAWPTTSSDTLGVLHSQLGAALTNFSLHNVPPSPVSLSKLQPVRCKQSYLFSHYSRLPCGTNETH